MQELHQQGHSKLKSDAEQVKQMKIEDKQKLNAEQAKQEVIEEDASCRNNSSLVILVQQLSHTCIKRLEALGYPVNICLVSTNATRVVVCQLFCFVSLGSQLVALFWAEASPCI